MKGQHEPIISEALFYLVQDVLDGRGHNRRTKVEISFKGLLYLPYVWKSAYGKQI